MSTQHRAHATSTFELELFQPDPDILYNLAAAARLAGVSRRSILMYCRAGLIQPVLQPPYGIMAFTEDTIRTIRRIEQLRSIHGINVHWIKTMFDLLDEVARLRAEVRFLRKQ